jgi:hypothetical protein
MTRLIPALAAGLLLLTGAVRAAEGPAGSWRLNLPGSNLTFLLKFEEKDGKWSAKYLGASVAAFPAVTVGDVTVLPDSLRFTMKIQGETSIDFDGRLPADPKTGKIAGSLQERGDKMIPLHLEPSKLKAFDKFEFNKETLDQSNNALVLLEAAVELLQGATEKKAKIEEVRGWADKAFKPADAHGPRWQRSAAMRLAQAVAGQKPYAPVAIEYARKAERLIDPDDDVGVQIEVLETVAQVLAKADKPDDAKQLQARLSKLEERDYADYLKKAPFKPDPYDGRKAKSDRALLVELFTSVEMEPGVAFESAFAALEKTYKPTDVILVQHHLSTRGQAPDPLFYPEAINRIRYYGSKVRGLPTAFVNGKPVTATGGPLPAARKAYGEFRQTIDPLLEKVADAKLQVDAKLKDNGIAIKASYADVARTGDKIRLRFALVEPHVRFLGGNGIRYHYGVVRALPGGPDGAAVTKKSGEQSVTVNLDETRAKLNEFLDDIKFSAANRPVSLKNLRVVAFIQDDESNDVLQAIQVDVK